MRSLFLALPLLAAACSAPTPPPVASPLATRSEYLCNTGERLSVRFDPEEKTASFGFGGRQIVLPQDTPAGDAFLYRKDGTVLRGDEMQVTFSRNRMPDLVCPRPPAPSPATDWSAASRVDLLCTDGTRLEARFDRTQETATVMWQGRSIRLAQEPAASGVSYRTPQYWLRGKGEEMTWTVGRAAPLACRTIGGLGEDVDAFGQEPGWNAKLRAGAIEAALDYGQKRVSSAPVAPTFGADGTRTYRTPTLALTISPAACSDTMSGEPFPLTAVLETGERKLNGCARPAGAPGPDPRP